MQADHQIVVQTERLTIRQFKRADSFELYEFLSSPAAERTVPHLVLEHQTAAMELIDVWRAAHESIGYSLWAVTVRSSGKLMGICGFDPHENNPLHVELLLHIKYMSDRYSSETLKALATHAFETLGATSAVVRSRPSDPANSIAVTRLGLERMQQRARGDAQVALYRLHPEHK